MLQLKYDTQLLIAMYVFDTTRITADWLSYNYEMRLTILNITMAFYYQIHNLYVTARNDGKIA